MSITTPFLWKFTFEFVQVCGEMNISTEFLWNKSHKMCGCVIPSLCFKYYETINIQTTQLWWQYLSMAGISSTLVSNLLGQTNIFNFKLFSSLLLTWKL